MSDNVVDSQKIPFLKPFPRLGQELIGGAKEHNTQDIAVL